MKLRFDNKVEFYITNVCNYTCDNCNRFNNHKFSGWQRWSDYEETYRRWSELIELQAIVVMGGEPTLNPTVNEWVVGLNQIFDCDVQVLTNATRLNQTPGLYESMLVRSPKRKAQNHIGISLHNMADFEMLRNNVLEFLDEGVIEFGTHLGISAPANVSDYRAFYTAVDRNGVMVNMWVSNNFSTAAVQLNQQGRYTVHNSDPVKSHSQCGFVEYKSYHFIRGNIYKCGPAALLPEFDEQHNLDISEEDRKIIHSYQPLTVENFDQYRNEWEESLKNPIPQCKFCSENPRAAIITPTRKGSAFKINT
jgi:hypothetical protein